MLSLIKTNTMSFKTYSFSTLKGETRKQAAITSYAQKVNCFRSEYEVACELANNPDKYRFNSKGILLTNSN